MLDDSGAAVPGVAVSLGQPGSYLERVATTDGVGHFELANLTNRTALYNSQPVFVGTRLVQPRTASVRLTRYF